MYNYDDEVYEDDFETLDINRINYVIDSLRDAFSGKDVEFEMESEYCTDWMIAINSKPGEVAFSGEDDGFTSTDLGGVYRAGASDTFISEKSYYLYINDRFGQDGCTSELYIDLQKAELK